MKSVYVFWLFITLIAAVACSDNNTQPDTILADTILGTPTPNAGTIVLDSFQRHWAGTLPARAPLADRLPERRLQVKRQEDSVSYAGSFSASSAQGGQVAAQVCRFYLKAGRKQSFAYLRFDTYTTTKAGRQMKWSREVGYRLNIGLPKPLEG